MKVITETDSYIITRETRARSNYRYEFVLYDQPNGVEVITTTEIERETELEFDDVDRENLLKTFAESYSTNSKEKALNAVKEKYSV